MPTGIVGAGRVGGNLAYWLSRRGWHIRTVFSRSEESARRVAHSVPTGVAESLEQVVRRCEIVFLTIPERVLPEVLEQIAEVERHRAKILVHMSGVLPSKILEMAGYEYFRVSAHPMAGIPPLDRVNNPFRGVFFGVEGDDVGMDLARAFVRDLGGRWWEIDPAKKPVYHTAAAVAANAVYANIAAAEFLLAQAGFPGEHIPDVISILIGNSVKNYKKFGIPKGITGPLVRDDFATVMVHLRALEDTPFLGMYVESMRVYAGLIGKKDAFERLLVDVFGVDPVRDARGPRGENGAD